MSYYISKTVSLDFESATQKITDELKKEGFGIVSQLDTHKVFKEKLNTDFRPYRILGACNPSFALQSINSEEKIGVLLPCNILIQEKDGKTEIAIIDSAAMTENLNNPDMAEISKKISKKLKNALSNV